MPCRMWLMRYSFRQCRRRVMTSAAVFDLCCKSYTNAGQIASPFFAFGQNRAVKGPVTGGPISYPWSRVKKQNQGHTGPKTGKKIAGFPPLMKKWPKYRTPWHGFSLSKIVRRVNHPALCGPCDSVSASCRRGVNAHRFPQPVCGDMLRSWPVSATFGGSFPAAMPDPSCGGFPWR